mgnify:CR=1 FL=1
MPEPNEVVEVVMTPSLLAFVATSASYVRALLDNAPSREATIFRSKAVGEPPLMLATAIWTALKDAIAAAGNGKTAVQLDAPATPERILSSIAKVKA